MKFSKPWPRRNDVGDENFYPEKRGRCGDGGESTASNKSRCHRHAHWIAVVWTTGAQASAHMFSPASELGGKFGELIIAAR